MLWFSLCTDFFYSKFDDLDQNHATKEKEIIVGSHHMVVLLMHVTYWLIDVSVCVCIFGK